MAKAEHDKILEKFDRIYEMMEELPEIEEDDNSQEELF